MVKGNLSEDTPAPLGERRTAITRWFPDVEQIKDDVLREKVIKVWLRIWEESKYKDLLAPLGPRGQDDESLVSHTNAVVAASRALALQVERQYGYPIDTDLLLAAALLHDVDKPVTFDSEAAGGRSEVGQKIGHGIYAAAVAIEEGLPLDVVHVIASHGLTTNIKPQTMIGILIQQADIVMAMAGSMAKGGTYHQRATVRLEVLR